MLINGVPGEQVEAADRGLAYGDGVFRTIECIEGQPLLWETQFACLQRDALALGLNVPEPDVLKSEVCRVAEGLPRAVAKIIVTRGVGQRGYAVPEQAVATRIVSAARWNGYPDELARDGITVRECTLRLALQPRLAGIKHLNRLEQVLARSEWNDPAIREGLMLDSEGYVIEGTMTNLVLVRSGVCHTPLLDRCGVSGTFLDWLRTETPVHGGRYTLDDLRAADEVWLGNSLAGIWPVARFGERHWEDFTVARHFQARWRQRTGSDRY